MTRRHSEEPFRNTQRPQWPGQAVARRVLRPRRPVPRNVLTTFLPVSRNALTAFLPRKAPAAKRSLLARTSAARDRRHTGAVADFGKKSGARYDRQSR